jgi:hypothetical protein
MHDFRHPALTITSFIGLLSLLLFMPGATALAQSKLPVNPPPANSLELANGAIHVVETPQERAAVIELVEKARQNADLHSPGSPAFTLKLSFTASGNAQVTGAGDMEETWLQPYAFRWKVRLGDYSLTRIATDHGIFDEPAAESVPMRVHMLRTAIFWPVGFQSMHTLIRTAKANWRGKDVTCVLASGDMNDPTPTPGRRWVEREFCVDSKTGLLQIFSDAPGIYVVYDYSNALQFHGRTVPGQISVMEGNTSVLEAHLESITEAAGTGPELLTVSKEMAARRAGPLLGGTLRFPRLVPLPPGAQMIQPVIVHAIVAGGGRVVDAELLDASAGTLGEAALNMVRHATYPEREPNARRQYEVFVDVKFISN